ncbi:hypothetical protein J6590_009260 [Homalodisca vitripennis]|nr:hypothetical protein J6590_009260 [Homalodisca vitripennis]
MNLKVNGFFLGRKGKPNLPSFKPLGPVRRTPSLYTIPDGVGKKHCHTLHKSNFTHSRQNQTSTELTPKRATTPDERKYSVSTKS